MSLFAGYLRLAMIITIRKRMISATQMQIEPAKNGDLTTLNLGATACWSHAHLVPYMWTGIRQAPIFPGFCSSRCVST